MSAASKKRFGGASVSPHLADGTFKRTGDVELYGFAEWLKGDPMLSCILTPQQARRLAVQLLVAADAVEAVSP